MSSSLNLEAAYNAVREAVLALPANDPTPNAQIKAAVEEILTQHITRALDAIDRNDSLEATQAIAQAMAVSSAWVAGTVWGWSAKLPIQGLALVFQSVRKTSPFGGQESMFARLLGEFGFSAVTRTKIANFTQGIAFGAAFAYGVNSFINVAKTFLSAATTPAADPLTLDLDGDGIETVGINSASPVMFDITGTGIQQSVGWVGADDGFLVRDLNGNGLIDSGAELFGDATQLAGGQRASDGFAALADLDANQDGVVNAADAAFASLRVWRDLDQDGMTDAGELLTLAALGITGLNVASTSHSQTLANGNQIADLGTYIKADGQVGTFGQTADVNLAVDTFTSQFTDTLPVSEAVNDIHWEMAA